MRTIIAGLLCLVSVGIAADSSEDDLVDGLLTSDAFVDGLTNYDFVSMRELLSEQMQTELSVEEMQETFAVHQKALGGLRYSFLTRVAGNEEGCQERRYAGLFAKGRAIVTTHVCHREERWQVTGFRVTPSLESMANHLINDVFAPQLGIGIIVTACDLDPEPEIGEKFQCETISGAGESIAFNLVRHGPADIEGDRYERLSEAPAEPSQQLLVAHSQRFVAHASNRRAGELHAEGALNLRSEVTIDEIRQVLDPLHGAFGPITKASLNRIGEAQAVGLPQVWMDVVFAKGATGKLALSFIPDRGEWKVYAFDFYADPGTKAESELMRLSLTRLARRVSGDGQATIDCDVEALIALQSVSCDAHAYGRDIKMQAQPSPPSADVPSVTVRLSTTDITVILRNKLAEIGADAGWQINRLHCDPEVPTGGELAHCLGHGPDGLRELTVLYVDGKVRLMHVREMGEG